MGCTVCKTKKCRTEAKDCFDVKKISLEQYLTPEVNQIAKSASLLVDNGRAGSLNRLEEIVEYCQSQGHHRIGIAYCFGLQPLAESVKKTLKQAGLKPVAVQCSTGGVLEKEIDTSKTKETVSCNPVGQARALKKKNVDFAIEMGLCLGHDVIFHKNLDIPFTTLLVKDRVYNHNPAMALNNYEDFNTRFVKAVAELPREMTVDELFTNLDNQTVEAIDLRSEREYKYAHVPGSRHIPLEELPDRISELPDRISELPEKEKNIVLISEDGIQSAYGIMLLYSRGYKSVFNLKGGCKHYREENLPVERSQLALV